MAYHEDDPTITHVMETMIENGMASIGEAFGILYNAAIKLERAKFLGAGRYKRSENRIGQANGFTDKQLSYSGWGDFFIHSHTKCFWDPACAGVT